MTYALQYLLEMKRGIQIAGLCLSLFSLTACGTADVGEECDGAGSTDDCVDGAICTNENDKNVCRVICVDDTNCAGTEACNGVTGTPVKSCQPK